MFVYSFADVRTLYAASYDSDRVVQFNSTSGLTYILPGKKHENPGAGTLKEPNLCNTRLLERA